ncbi:hypothetical protein SAMN02745131_01959 [Flavisolibacter ginsengisoli DSM 18119]|jgi:CubicO group peptidase (beta-lactamase class C family)|uniref:Uncharacterized protein n=1 Tax=Flavisolibacter ginsengisoli DSM 18119 TaxID=1121884 RepID=A0A1M4ZJ39_9BACT|nr:hypothetical protein SAMN02745131_01959 [Flavisolibacter ginsengisoli DSM 18119]
MKHSKVNPVTYFKNHADINPHSASTFLVVYSVRKLFTGLAIAALID